MKDPDDLSADLVDPLLRATDVSRDGADVRSLMPQIYGQLRAFAARQFQRERGSTLQPTACVHEAFMRLVEQKDLQWRSKTHFYALAAREVRRALIDHWRRKTALRRNGKKQPLDSAAEVVVTSGSELTPTDLLALDEALHGLAEHHGRPARVAELALFAGLTQNEIAQLLELSRKTIAADWSFARTWLMRELQR